MKALAAVAISVVSLGALASAEIQSKEALSEFFQSSDGSRSLKATADAVEICSDGCQHYTSKGGVAASEVWDLIFLHEYYYIGRGPVKEFREKYASLAQSLMSKYGRSCPRAEPNARPGCVIGYLGIRNDIHFAHIFEKNGQRCEVWSHLVHSKTIYESKCQKVEHAS